MFYGKLVAGLIGLLVAGLPGLLLGLLVGHAFDRGLGHTMGFGNPEHLQQVQKSFFETCFRLLGAVAKADGRVCESEVAHAEEVMQQLGVFGEQRQVAIEHFKTGSEAAFDPAPAIADFKQVCGSHRQLPHTLLVFLISMALADGDVDEAERGVLQSVAGLLGFSAERFQQLLEMVLAQSHFQQQYQSSHSRPVQDQISDAYRALGVKADCSDRELKTAYRRLMSENHPDKLIAQGVPEEMIKLATERSQEIQAAYEMVRKSRKPG